jgi:cysteinyl-tRNA synthetase
LANGPEGENTLAPVLEDLYDQALDAMCNDLNTAVALAKALEGARTITRETNLSRTDAEAGRRFLDRINALLGIVCHDAGPTCGLPAVPRAPKVDEAYVQARIDERAALKKAKDFAGADAIRAELDGQGIELRDTPEGTFWKHKGPI